MPGLAGVSIVGLFNAPIGIGESARRQARALAAVGVPTSNHPVTMANLPTVEFEPLDYGEPRFRNVILHLNPPEMLYPGYLASKFALPRLYRIGYWAWELPVVPPTWVPALQFVNEVWTPSNFVAEAFADATKKPVRVVPHAVPPNTIDRREARARLGLPLDAYVFLTILDTNSFPMRKNPEGTIAAFEAAFPVSGPSAPMLVVKIHGKANRTPFFRDLIERSRQSTSIHVIDQTLTDEEMRNLQASCDCFVSLHRSEGFGLNIAECMAAGRLVITTDFSGNRDFAKAYNSLPIPYTPRLVLPDDYLHGRGQWWAEPIHEAAVEAMRWAVAHETEAARLARAAKSDMRAYYSFDAVGHTAKRLLSELPAFALDATGKSVFDRRAPVTLAGGAVARTGRNAPCPCGSAQKFKNCHGAIRFEVEESRKLRPWSGA